MFLDKFIENNSRDRLPPVPKPHSISAIFSHTRRHSQPPNNLMPPSIQTKLSVQAMRTKRGEGSFRIKAQMNRKCPQVKTYDNHGHTPEDIPQLLRRCNYPSNSVYIPSPTVPVPFMNPQKAEDFESLLAMFAQSPELIMNLDADTMDLLFEVVETNMLRIIHEIPKEYILGDTQTPITISNWSLLNYVHRIFIQILRNVDNAITNRWVDHKFISRLLNLYNSPDANEQGSAEIIITQVFEMFPHNRKFIFDRLLGKLSDHINGIVPYICIQPTLRFFIKFFQTVDTWNAGYSHFFEKYFFPLFSTDFVNEFYQNLSSLCFIFYTRDQKCPEFALKYLLFHWPRTNSSKQVIYLHQISLISPSLNINNLIPQIQKLFQIICNCICSQNFKINIAALRLISDQNFMYTYRVVHQDIIPRIFERLKELDNHWNSETKTQLSETYQVIYTIETNLKCSSPRPKNLFSMTKEKPELEWKKVLEMATMNDETINFDSLSKQVDLVYV